MNMFTQAQLEVLRTLVRLWTVNKFVLIGASAMRLHLGPLYRETHDIDLLLEVTLGHYPAGLESQEGWVGHPMREHAWRAPGNVTVDVLPALPERTGQDTLIWPKSGARMSLTGLRLAADRAERMNLAPQLTIRVAPLATIALLKMVAYLDRPHERGHDLGDIALILDAYVSDGDERRFDDSIFSRGLTFEEISPFLLGQFLRSMVNAQERDAIDRFLLRVKGTGGPDATQAKMLRVAPPGWHREPEELLLRFRAFERGIASEQSCGLE